MSRRRPFAYAVAVGLTVLLVPMVWDSAADAAEPPPTSTADSTAPDYTGTVEALTGTGEHDDNPAWLSKVVA